VRLVFPLRSDVTSRRSARRVQRGGVALDAARERAVPRRNVRRGPGARGPTAYRSTRLRSARSQGARLDAAQERAGPVAANGKLRRVTGWPVFWVRHRAHVRRTLHTPGAARLVETSTPLFRSRRGLSLAHWSRPATVWHRNTRRGLAVYLPGVARVAETVAVAADAPAGEGRYPGLFSMVY
jgi:hypothetical protein